MVKLATVKASNDCFAGEQHEGRVCVFAGATSGIGFSTLQKLVTMLRASIFYVLGRSEEEFLDQLKKLRALSPTSKVVFVNTQVSLISHIDAACKQIVAAESKVDYLCMSPGGMPFQGAVYTDEGLELCFALSYYSRLRLLTNLLPLLHRSSNPRVLSVLNGTKEKRIDESDLGLDRNWGIVAVVNHTTMCTSLAFDYLAAHDSNNNNGGGGGAQKSRLTLIHATPGLVNTGTPRKTYPSIKDGYAWWAFISVMQIVSGWIIVFFGMALAESGERHAFHLTSGDFAPGSWRTDRLNNVVADNDALAYYKDRGWTEKNWDFTQRVWERTPSRSA